MSPPTVSAGPLPQISTARIVVVRRDSAGDDEGLLRHPHVDRIARVGPVQTHRGDAVGDRVVDRSRRGVVTERLDPGCGVGELTQAT